MTARSATHLDADFSTMDGWEAWCRASDDGCPSAKHDLRREPEIVDGDCAQLGTIVLMSMAALFWVGMIWCAWRVFA